MADIALNTANRVEIVESIQQMTLVAAEAIVPGAPCKINPLTGLASNGNGTNAGEARIWGIATGQLPIVAGMPVTLLRRGVLDGFNLTAQAWDAPIYVSDTDGTLGDIVGTVTLAIGRVIPATANLRGAAFDKLLSVEL